MSGNLFKRSVAVRLRTPFSFAASSPARP
jgi:hypothetical protein